MRRLKVEKEKKLASLRPEKFSPKTDAGEELELGKSSGRAGEELELGKSSSWGRAREELGKSWGKV